MKVILKGITGSNAYGLNTPDSDIDERGAFVVPTEQILSVFRYKETIDQTDPDICLHEVGKIVRLALNNNPNILELFYLEDYTELTKEGQWLIDIREAFLSQKVRKTYGGYAISQIRRLETRAAAGDSSFKSKLRKRYSKHARHCFRLIQQGAQILSEGTLTVKVPNPEELFEIGNLEPEALKERFEKEFKLLDDTPSSLPEEPNYEKANNVLLEIREKNW